jgi:hypothetical protein
MHLINDQVLSRRFVAEARYNLSSSITTEAEERVSFDKVYLRYPPVEQRGVGVSPRATGFGTNFEPFYSKPIRPFYCHPDLNLKGEAKRQGDCRGEQRGCPILFMSPADLSISAGRPGRLDDPEYRALLSKVVDSARGCVIVLRNGSLRSLWIDNVGTTQFRDSRESIKWQNL